MSWRWESDARTRAILLCLAPRGERPTCVRARRARDQIFEVPRDQAECAARKTKRAAQLSLILTLSPRDAREPAFRSEISPGGRGLSLAPEFRWCLHRSSLVGRRGRISLPGSRP